MEKLFIVLFTLVFILPLYSMENFRIKRWSLEGTTLIQCVEQLGETTTDLCVQEKRGKDDTVYSGYKIVLQPNESGIEWKLEGDEAKSEWDALNNKHDEDKARRLRSTQPVLANELVRITLE